MSNFKIEKLPLLKNRLYFIIRFNPDKYYENNKIKNPTIATRLPILKKEVEKHTPLRSKYIYKEDNIPEYPSAWKNVYLSKMQKTVWRNLFKFY